MIWMLTFMLAGVEPAAASSGTTALPAPVRTTQPSADTLLTADWRRVRPMDRRVQSVVEEGMRRSGTFNALVAALQATDVIVYVEATFSLPREMAGRLLLQAVTSEGRYLRVQLRATLRPDAMISTLAHELRHALEVAAHRDVLSHEGLDALYRRIGHASVTVARGYETRAAIEAAVAVLAELAGRRPAGPAPPHATSPSGGV